MLNENMKKNNGALFRDKLKNFSNLKKNENFGILLALVILIILASILSSHFINPNNLLNILKQNSVLGIVVIGMSIVIISGGIDLSVGAIVGFCGLVAGYLKELPFIIIFLAVIATGVVIGFINGFLIANRKLEPFIVTLSIMITLRGLSLFLTGGGYIAKVDSFSWLGKGGIGPFPIPAILLICMYIIFQVVMVKTLFGRNVFAIGGNENAAKLSGIKTERTKIFVYMLCAILCAVASLVNVSRLSVAEPLAATNLEVDAIAAALVGGASLLGGRGSIPGGFIGLIVLAILSNIFNLLGFKSAEQQIIKGLIIIVAVLLSQRQKAKYR